MPIQNDQSITFICNVVAIFVQQYMQIIRNAVCKVYSPPDDMAHTGDPRYGT